MPRNIEVTNADWNAVQKAHAELSIELTNNMVELSNIDIRREELKQKGTEIRNIMKALCVILDKMSGI